MVCEDPVDPEVHDATHRVATLAAYAVVPQTLRRLGGLQPLCGIGVTSLIKVIEKPELCIARSADSLPAPGPLTKIEMLRMP